MSLQKIVVAAVLSAALAAVFATHVVTRFTPHRTKLLVASVPASAGTVRLTAEVAEGDGLPAPFAVVGRVNNRSSDARSVNIEIDGDHVCSATIGPKHTARFDCQAAVQWQPTGVARQLTFTSPGDDWALEYLEVATHHGGTGGGKEIAILPLGFQHLARPRWFSAVLCWFLITGLFLYPRPAFPNQIIRIASITLAAIGVGALALTAVSSLVSPFNVVLSPGTFARAVALIFAWQLVAPREGLARRSGEWILRTLDGAVRRRAVAAGLVGCLVFAGFGLVARRALEERHHGNYSGFISIDRLFAERNPLLQGRRDVMEQLRLGDGGYDGQFMYFMIYDPFIRALRDDVARYRSFIDAPPYRYGRIGYSLLTKVVSLDDAMRYPAAMVWIILIATGVAGACASMLAARAGYTPAWGLVVLLIPGFWSSLDASLPEPLAAALMLGGLLCLQSNRWWLAGLLCASSLMVRETGVIFVCSFAVLAYQRTRSRRALGFAALALAPICLWRLYVGFTLYPDFGTRAFFFDPGDLTVPFAGFIELWGVVWRGEYFNSDRALVSAAITYPCVLAVGLGVAVISLTRQVTPVAIAATLYGLLAVSLNYAAIWVHVGNGQRGTFELFIALGLLAVTPHSRAKWLNGCWSAFLLLTAVYTLVTGLDADFVRKTLIPLG
jgi:hypothetical protein